MRFVFFLALAGCDAPGDGPIGTDGPVVAGCDVGAEPQLWIGKGEQEWASSDDEDGRTLLVHGMQGGFHTFLSLRAQHLNLDQDWTLSVEGFLDGERTAWADLVRTPECNGDADFGESIGTWLIWRAQPEELHDQVVKIDVSVTDADGRVVSATEEQRIWDLRQVED
ncbi:MAG: hypothetical protein AB8H79_10980 [Myxococcota bacterium]